MESLATAEATSADTFPEAFGKTLEVARPGTNGIVISTRAVDLADTERFAKLWRKYATACLAWSFAIDQRRESNLSDYFIPS